MMMMMMEFLTITMMIIRPRIDDVNEDDKILTMMNDIRTQSTKQCLNY